MAKKKTEGTKEETKREKWLRIVNARVNKALSAIDNIGKARGSAYEYTTADIEKIVTVLTNHTVRMKQALEGKSAGSAGFQLT